MIKIYVIEGTKEVLKQIQERTISYLFLHICCIVDGIVNFIWMRRCINNYPHPVCGIDRYQFKKKHISTWSPCFQYTLSACQQAFSFSNTKFSLYISPYISFSKLVPMTYVLPFLRVLLRRLRMLHEFVRKQDLICFCSIDQ